MKPRSFLTVFTTFFILHVLAQSDSVIVQANSRLPKDSLKKVQLLNSFDAFIRQMDSPNIKNAYVLPGARLETFI